MRTAFAAAALILALCAQAQARPRDEVMINVYRCAGQASTRVWLDCYYGAAQPQRAALGMSPAPAAQVMLVATPPAPGMPQDLPTRDAVVAAAARCGSVAAERPWLDCYYAAANPVRTLLGLAPVATAAPLPPPMRKDKGLLAETFGKPELKDAGRVVAYKFDSQGYFTLTLANGEVWRQLDGDTSYAHWYKKPETMQATITAGAIGSFNLRVKGDPHGYKVRRVA